MKTLFLKNKFVPYALWMLLLSIIAITWFNTNRLNKEQMELAKHQENFHTAYHAATIAHELANKEAFDLLINTGHILDVLYEGVMSEGRRRDIARGRLYREASPVYEHLGEKYLRQLHFHLPDGKSYLRFHKPERYGDDLFDARPLVKLANQERRAVHGFETGRLISGYRYVYPLMYRGFFLGTVETSIPVKSILDTLHTINTSKEYAFIVNKKIAGALLFDDQKYLYTDASLHKDFVIEDANSQLPGSAKPLSQEAKAINEQVSHNPLLQKALEKEEPFATFVQLKDVTYAISLEPMHGLGRGVEGYVIAYEKDETPKQLWRDFNLVMGTYVLFAMVVIALLWLASKRAWQNEEQKEELRTITDTLAEGIYVMNAQGIIEKTNSTTCDILGYTKEELLGFEAHGLFHTHALNHFMPMRECPIHEALVHQKPYYSEEEFFTCKDGKVIPVILNARPLIREDRETLLVVAFYNNTEAYEHQATMRLLQKALEASANAVVITNKEAVIEWANPAFENLTGYSAGEALGQKPKELVRSGLQDDTFYAPMWQTILLGKPWHGELINKRKDGSLYHEEMSITPVSNRSGVIEHFIAIKQDISARQHAFEELKIAKMEAEAATEAKAQFLANMSHEIRTPLNAIIGFGDLMKDVALNEKQADLLSKINTASNVLLNIVNDILDYSKIEAGKLELEIKEVSLKEQLSRIEEMFSQTAKLKGLELHVSLDEKVPLVIFADGLRLTQVLMNLTSNALKFTHEGGVRVRVDLVKHDKTHAQIRFSVHDTGIGISQEKIASLFQPFTQADISITRKYGGSGLGLSIVHKLIEAMGSRIEVQSSEGEGSTFFFTLDVPIAKNQSLIHAKPTAIEPPHLQEYSILVVEDNPVNQEVAKAIIGRTGAEVVLANNGKEGVETFMANPERFMCILMDIQMPIMNGYEATARIREIDTKIPIIALTAAATVEDNAKAVESGMNEHLSKPIHPQALYALLSMVSQVSYPLASAPQKTQPSTVSTASLPTLLIVDDDATDIQTLSAILKSDYRIKVSTDGASALKLAREIKGLELILLDIMMPKMDGYEVCKALKENSITQKIPVVFVSAKDAAEDEAYGFSLGATDYITKPFNPAIVRVRVKHQIELKAQNDALEKLSMTDGLTKIRNRGYFDAYYDIAYKEVSREGGVLCVMMMDIDYFKRYNDHYGHGAGDVCLTNVANALKNALQRPSDLVARYGGEEFVVVLKNISYEGAIKVAEALRLSVETLHMPHEDSSVIPYVSISVGVAFKKLDSTLSPEELLKRADDALYEAKNNGRNQVVYYRV